MICSHCLTCCGKFQMWSLNYAFLIVVVLGSPVSATEVYVDDIDWT